MYHYLEEEFEHLKTKLIKMGSLVEEQINFSLRAVFENNPELAKTVLERDEKVDKFDIKIDKLCQKIFALTQPVAVDLRLGMAALSINKDLERIGDIAVNIAEKTEFLSGYKDLLSDSGIVDMASKSKIILKNTLDSLVNNDHELAYDVIKSDNIIDELDRTVFRNIIELMTQNRNLIKPGSYAILISKNLERLSDHCTNIAEEVVFLTESKIIKHKKDLNKGQSEQDTNV
ncbi:MAG: phosphate signaling complex protein PhoU [Ignavibacteria bacterium]|nr:phosphate signaling complex protein PhoU [Ignavibacteria bacterium]